MHNLDRALQEFESATDALETSYEFDEETEGEGDYETEGDFEAEEEYQREYDGEGEATLPGEYEAVFDEIEEMEHAAALLEVQDEDELDHFLGGLIRKVTRKLGRALPSPLRGALAGTLKKVARSALPVAGAAVGNLFAPGVGGLVGGRLASTAGKMFGLELEGMSQEDQQFEVARRVVSLGAEATKAASQTNQAAPGRPPAQTAKDAVLQAAQTHAPGLAGAALGGTAGGALPQALRAQGTGPGRRSGRWFRRGRRIIILGV